jgi:hypothetical protein
MNPYPYYYAVCQLCVGFQVRHSQGGTQARSFVAHRVSDLEPLSDLGADPHIEIYDYQSGKRAAELADMFSDSGLIHSHPNTEPWPNSYNRLEICYRTKPSGRAYRRLTELIPSQHYAKMELLNPRTYINPRTRKRDVNLVRMLDPKNSVDLVIILPSR